MLTKNTSSGTTLVFAKLEDEPGVMVGEFCLPSPWPTMSWRCFGLDPVAEDAFPESLPHLRESGDTLTVWCSDGLCVVFYASRQLPSGNFSTRYF